MEIPPEIVNLSNNILTASLDDLDFVWFPEPVQTVFTVNDVMRAVRNFLRSCCLPRFTEPLPANLNLVQIMQFTQQKFSEKVREVMHRTPNNDHRKLVHIIEIAARMARDLTDSTHNQRALDCLSLCLARELHYYETRMNSLSIIPGKQWDFFLLECWSISMDNLLRIVGRRS